MRAPTPLVTNNKQPKAALHNLWGGSYYHRSKQACYYGRSEMAGELFGWVCLFAHVAWGIYCIWVGERTRPRIHTLGPGKGLLGQAIASHFPSPGTMLKVDLLTDLHVGHGIWLNQWVDMKQHVISWMGDYKWSYITSVIHKGDVVCVECLEPVKEAWPSKRYRVLKRVRNFRLDSEVFVSIATVPTLRED